MPQPPAGSLLSTGTLRGSSREWEEKGPDDVGVAVPGVTGGVKAGERRDGGGGCTGREAGLDVCVEVARLSSRSDRLLAEACGCDCDSDSVPGCGAEMS